MMNQRSIQRIINGVQTSDGAGVNLTRIIGGHELDMLDPFLLLDEFGSSNPDDYIAGFPPHPHRGFETITYMVKGKWKHKDSAGNEGLLGDGSVQWMTAGRGIVHSEMPVQTNGQVRGFQLWLNLPKEKKMVEPAYVDIPAAAIPSVSFNGGYLKVISGRFNGAIGPGAPHTGMLYYDVHLTSNAEIEMYIDDGWNTFIYIYGGSVLDDQTISTGQLAVFNQRGKLKLNAGDEGVQCIVAAGKPLKEPVVRGGPFVMNTRGEVLQAFSDYQEGMFGI